MDDPLTVRITIGDTTLEINAANPQKAIFLTRGVLAAMQNIVECDLESPADTCSDKLHRLGSLISEKAPEHYFVSRSECWDGPIRVHPSLN